MTYPHLKAKESFLLWEWKEKGRRKQEWWGITQWKKHSERLELPEFRWRPAQLQHSSSEQAPWAWLFSHSEGPQKILQGVNQRSGTQISLQLPKSEHGAEFVGRLPVRGSKCVSVVWRQGWPSIHSPNGSLAVRSMAMLPSFRLGMKMDPHYN